MAGVVLGKASIYRCPSCARRFPRSFLGPCLCIVLVDNTLGEEVAVDIVKRAYLKTLEEYKAEPGWPDISDFEENVRREIIRLIKVRAYSGRDWPRELGPLPTELRSERK